MASNRLLDSTHEIVFSEKEPLAKYYKILQTEWESQYIEIDHLRVLGNIFDEKRVIHREFVQALLYFSAIADVACGGLGFLGQPLHAKQLSHRIFMGVANLLLNNTSTLSTISKHHGVVLPKMRTPQAGMTVRSISHHLTFHTTEVEVTWRTFPLLFKGDDKLNILAVPYPYIVKDVDFIPRPDDGQSVRFFEPKIKGKLLNYEFIHKMVDWVGRSAEQGTEIDIIVLPEMALAYKASPRTHQVPKPSLSSADTPHTVIIAKTSPPPVQPAENSTPVQQVPVVTVITADYILKSLTLNVTPNLTVSSHRRNPYSYYLEGKKDYLDDIL